GVGASQTDVPSSTAASLLKNRSAKDFFARLGFVGIFVTENIMHAIHFEFEVDHMVSPAVAPLPREFAVSLHLVHIIFGLFGAIFVLVSGFDTAGRTALTKGTSMMLVFMATITWTWWINRQGVVYWHLDPVPFWDVNCSAEKRNRTVHILKNISIVGALTMLQQMAKYESKDSPGRPSFLEGLITALRPWSFAGIIGPYLVLLAVLRCLLHVELPGYTIVFVLLVSLLAVQATANLVNSYKDFEKGIDTVESAGDRTLVDGLVSPTMLKALAAIALLWWLIFFFWSVLATNFSLTVLSWATVGTLLAFGYTAGPAPLKYIGLGDLTVFICFGPGVITYCSVVLVGTVMWQALLLTAPASLYVVGILHANNYRDIEVDSMGGARTVAILLGPKASLVYYNVLVLGAHILALVFGWICGCYGVAGTIFVLPQSLWLCVRIRRPHLLRDQDEETAKSMMMFSVALALGILSMPGESLSALSMGICALVTFVLKVAVPHMSQVVRGASRVEGLGAPMCSAAPSSPALQPPRRVATASVAAPSATASWAPAANTPAPVATAYPAQPAPTANSGQACQPGTAEVLRAGSVACSVTLPVKVSSESSGSAHAGASLSTEAAARGEDHTGTSGGTQQAYASEGSVAASAGDATVGALRSEIEGLRAELDVLRALLDEGLQQRQEAERSQNALISKVEQLSNCKLHAQQQMREAHTEMQWLRGELARCHRHARSEELETWPEDKIDREPPRTASWSPPKKSASSPPSPGRHRARANPAQNCAALGSDATFQCGKGMSRSSSYKGASYEPAPHTDEVDEMWRCALQRFPQHPHWCLVKEKRCVYRMGSQHGKKIVCRVTHGGLQVRVGGGWMAALPFLERYGPTHMGQKNGEDLQYNCTNVDLPPSMERLLVPTKSWAQRIGISKTPDLREQRRLQVDAEDDPPEANARTRSMSQKRMAWSHLATAPDGLGHASQATSEGEGSQALQPLPWPGHTRCRQTERGKL
ncbi:ubiad1, partial [Symbiodinium pilosum]